MTFLDKINRFPPCACRLVARSRKGSKKGASVRELAKRSGIPKTKVSEISKLTKWDTVSAWECVLFSQACGVDLCNVSKEIDKLRKLKFSNIRTAHPAQRRMYMNLLASDSSKSNRD